MEAVSLQAITSALILYINAAMQVADLQTDIPQIHFVPQSQIEAKACDNKSCGSVLGWFSNEDQAIYLKDTLDIQNDMQARGILLHELVHYVQHENNTPTLENECLTWKAREIQAYNIQYNWLYDNRVRVATPTYNIALVAFESLQCPGQKQSFK